MIVLDENFPESQRLLLTSRRIRTRQIGEDLGWSGMKDEEILRLLHSSPKPTFFTLDSDFYGPSLCHPKYCLVQVDANDTEAAFFVRRTLDHSQFSASASRMGAVLRVSQGGILFWRLHDRAGTRLSW